MSSPEDALLAQQAESLGMRFILRTSLELESVFAQLQDDVSSERQSLERIGRIVHGIAGTAATLGFPAVSTCALDVMSDVRQASFENLLRHLQALNAEVQRTRQALDQRTAPGDCQCSKP
jgi:HPt (histidine-containing phosphotransfer) domain-containing protein